jgi:hypothetical protein
MAARKKRLSDCGVALGGGPSRAAVSSVRHGVRPTTTARRSSALISYQYNHMNTEERIQNATELAIEAFWASIVKSFPEPHFSDPSPSTSLKFFDTAQEAVREWVSANASVPHADDFYRVRIPAGEWQSVPVDPEIVAAVEAELGPTDPEIWCSCNDDRVSVDFRDDEECDCGIEKHHYHCTACGGLYQIG